MRVALEAEDDGSRTLLLVVGIVDVGSLKNLLTAFRAPKGADASVKAATVGKRNEFKNGLIDIVRSVEKLLIGGDPRILDVINRAKHTNIQKVLEDQLIDLITTKEELDAEEDASVAM